MLKKAIREGLPGPGNYSLKLDRSTPAFKFGSEKREWIAKNETPGPGQYKVPCSMVDVPTYLRTNGFSGNYRYV